MEKNLTKEECWWALRTRATPANPDNNVFYTVKETQEILRTSKIKIVNSQGHIEIAGKWYQLSHEDLWEQCCTGRYHGDPEETRQEFIEDILYGSRFKNFGNGDLFVIIDSLSER